MCLSERHLVKRSPRPAPPHVSVSPVSVDTGWLYSVAFQDICDCYEKYSWDVKSLVMDKKALQVAQIVLNVLQLPVS